jgi:hypothetical protein
MTAVTEDTDDTEEDVKVLKTDELFRRLSAAIRAIPMFDPDDRGAWHRAWDEVRRYHDELAARYPRDARPPDLNGSPAAP